MRLPITWSEFGTPLLATLQAVPSVPVPPVSE